MDEMKQAVPGLNPDGTMRAHCVEDLTTILRRIYVTLGGKPDLETHALDYLLCVERRADSLLDRLSAAEARVKELEGENAVHRKARSELRDWWRFDDHQRHTHSYHTREDFIERWDAAAAAARAEKEEDRR